MKSFTEKNNKENTDKSVSAKEGCAYFSNIRQHICDELKQSKSTIKVAVCLFTCTELFDLLCTKLKEGKSVELIVLNDSINNKLGGLNFQEFIDLGGKFYFSDIENPMHNKYCIIDNSTLINGSYNWTYFAEDKNFENIMIFKKHKVIADFDNDFTRLKEQCILVEDVANQANMTAQKSTIIEDVRLAKETDIVIDSKVELGKEQLTLNATIGEIALNDVFVEFIPKGTKLPTLPTKEEFNKTLTTAFDNQIRCKKNIRYGESSVGSENSEIGTFVITNIPPLPKGKIGIETRFSIDEIGILTVKVKVRETGEITIQKFDIRNIVS